MGTDQNVKFKQGKSGLTLNLEGIKFDNIDTIIEVQTS